MKGAIAVCFLALAAVTLARPDEKYTDRYDYINVEEILQNKVIMHQYVECCMGRGKCTPEAKELRNNLSDALQNNCAKCTDVQKEGAKLVITHLIKHMPQAWEELKGKYDPTGVYSTRYEDQLKQVQN